MTAESKQHLSEEELDDLLIGLGTKAALQHVSDCAACRARVEEFRSALQQIDASSMAWSRIRAAAMEPPPVPAEKRRWSFITIGWIAASVLMAVLAIPVWHSVQRPREQAAQPPEIRATPPAAAPAEDSTAQIAADNKLLHEVDEALNASEASPLEEFTGPGRSKAKTRTQ